MLDKIENNEYIAVPIEEYKKILEIINYDIEEISKKLDYKGKGRNKLIDSLEAEIRRQKEIRLSTKGVGGFAERLRTRIEGQTEGLKFAIEKIKEMEENKI